MNFLTMGYATEHLGTSARVVAVPSHAGEELRSDLEALLYEWLRGKIETLRVLPGGHYDPEKETMREVSESGRDPENPKRRTYESTKVPLERRHVIAIQRLERDELTLDTHGSDGNKIAPFAKIWLEDGSKVYVAMPKKKRKPGQKAKLPDHGSDD